jgi:hypothetical protein
MAMSNQLATTAAKVSMDNKVDGMLKIREHFDKPMFQAIGKVTGTDNNSGMLIVVGVLIFIFELQHIMALFAYANALLRLNRKGRNGTTDKSPLSPAPLGNLSAPVSGFNGLANSAKQTVGEYAAKVEEGLKAAPELIATEMMRADYANKQVLADTSDVLRNVGNKLDAALLKKSEGFKQSPEQLAHVMELAGINTPTPLPKMPVVETIQRIYADVKASGATSQEAIQAAVFDAYARIPAPAELDDKDLAKVSDKITDKLIAKTPTPSVPVNQKQGATGLHNPALGTAEEHYSLPLPVSKNDAMQQYGTDGTDGSVPNGTERNAMERVGTGEIEAFHSVPTRSTEKGGSVPDTKEEGASIENNAENFEKMRKVFEENELLETGREVFCPVCTVPFLKKRSNQRFCCTKDKAHYWKLAKRNGYRGKEQNGTDGTD